MKKFCFAFLFIASCYYGGSSVKCESIQDSNAFVCDIDKAENTDLCFDVFFDDSSSERICNRSGFMRGEHSSAEVTQVKRAKIVSEEFSESSIGLIISLSFLGWALLIIICLGCIFAYDGPYSDMRKEFLTITIVIVCGLFHFIGLLLLWLIFVTREEMRERKVKK